ncbi:unnamed protein product [Mucor fragilis]
MKVQLLFTFLVVLFATIASAKPLKARGLAGDLVKTVKNLLHHGIGTFFDPESEGGSQGACGPYADENSQIVAMNAHQYGNLNKKSHWCGKKLKICHKTKCTIATVTDACPGCDNGCLDLTPAVWGQLESDYNKGIIPIDWDEWNGDDDEDEDDERT